MKSVDLRNEKMALEELLHLAADGAVLVVAGDGHEFVVAEADDFDAEVEALRSSSRFQTFLDERMRPGVRIPIEEIEKEVEKELKAASS